MVNKLEFSGKNGFHVIKYSQWNIYIFIFVLNVFYCIFVSNVPYQPLQPDSHNPAASAAAYSSLKESGKRIPSLTPKASQQISQFYQGLKPKSGSHLAALQVRELSVIKYSF